jgi:hypothetical protein
MKLSLASFLGAVAAAGSHSHIHNESRQHSHLKRLSRPVNGGGIDLKQNARIQKARFSSCLGELRATRKKIVEHYARERVIPVLRKKHNLAPRGPKHNTTRLARRIKMRVPFAFTERSFTFFDAQLFGFSDTRRSTVDFTEDFGPIKRGDSFDCVMIFERAHMYCYHDAFIKHSLTFEIVDGKCSFVREDNKP